MEDAFAINFSSRKYSLFQPVSKLIRRNSFTGRALHNKFLTDRSSATRFLALRLSTDRTYVEFSLCCAFLSPEQTAVCALYVCIHNGNYSNFSPYSPKKNLRSNGYEYSPSTIKALKRLINYFVSIRIFRKRHAQSEGRAFPTSGSLVRPFGCIRFPQCWWQESPIRTRCTICTASNVRVRAASVCVTSFIFPVVCSQWCHIRRFI